MNSYCRVLLPLALVVLLTGAWGDGCVIIIQPIDDDDDVCELDCILAVNEDGEEICECREPEPCELASGESRAPGDVVSDDDCSICRCRADGQVICEEQENCGGGCWSDDGELYPPGSSIDDGCNSCFCDESGNWACTERACECDAVNDPSCNGGGVCYLEDGQVVQAGEWFDAGDGCNSCWCDESGNIGCTEMACPCDDQTDPNCGGGGGYCYLDDGQVVPAGEWFDAGDGCNSCVCDESGNVGCTEMACPCEDPNADGECGGGGQQPCTLACEYGFVTDEAGNEKCQCNEPVRCDGETVCDMVAPTCPEGQVPSIVNGCYGECVRVEQCAL